MAHYLLILCSSIPIIPFLLIAKKEKHIVMLYLTFALILFIQNFTLMFTSTIFTFFLICLFLLYSKCQIIYSFTFACLYFSNKIFLEFIVNFVVSLISIQLSWWKIVLLQVTISFLGQYLLTKMETLLYSKYIYSLSPAILLSALSSIGFAYYLWNFDLPGIQAAGSTELLQNIIFIAVLGILTILFFAVIAIQRTIDEKIALEHDRAELESSQLYYQDLAKNAELIRNFKHDFQNICLGMDLAIQRGKMDEVIAYYEKYVKKPSNDLVRFNTDLSFISKIKNSPIRSLLYAKLGLIDSDKIQLYLSIEDTVVFSEELLATLVRGLGIILDNALEELETLENGKLDISFHKENTDSVIIVKNSCRSSTPPFYQLRQNGFSTKGPNRGYGLSSLDNCFKDYPYQMTTLVDDDYFIQTIRIEGVRQQ